MESFESYRPYLFSIAYRMLGSAMDAEDMVQETFLRYQTTPPELIRSQKAFLTTILTRVCMDQLRLAHRKREQYIGPWLPEPISSAEVADAGEPEQRVELEESIALAFLVLLEQLQPFERAVFVLRESFGYAFAEIALILHKSEAACRRSFSRAKQHLHTQRPRFSASRETHQRLLDSYIQAVERGDMQSLMNLLAEDVTLWADAGGKRKQAVLRPIHGCDAVARLSIGIMRFLPPGHRTELTDINGSPGVVIRTDNTPFSVLTIDVQAGRIQTVYVIANPEKLTRIA